jgi:serine/threonine protein kinase
MLDFEEIIITYTSTLIFNYFVDVCMSFEVLGPNLLTMIRRYHHKGIPIHIVKRITKQMLMGLDYLHHDCGIIHTDMKPEVILLYTVYTPVYISKLSLPSSIMRRRFFGVRLSNSLIEYSN